MMRKWVSHIFDLPPDVTNKFSRIEVIGPFHLQVENYIGLDYFSSREVKLKIKPGSLRIIGKDLRIKDITIEAIRIEGTIQELKYTE